MLPWLYLGWFGVRRETQRLMYIFLTLCLLLLAGWGSLFACTTFRWIFIEWRFFATMAVAASLLLICTTVLGVVCFYNFGKGLKTFCEFAGFNLDTEFVTDVLDSYSAQ